MTYPRHNRRSMLAATAAGLGAITLGCRSEPEEVKKDEPSRRLDVPLRIAWASKTDDFSSVDAAWSSVSQLPLDISAIEIARDRPAELPPQLLAGSERNDVLVYPLASVAELFVEEQLIAFDPDRIDAIEQANGELFTALRNGAARYAGEAVAIPLGGRVPALFSIDEVKPFSSWADYDVWVGELDGAAGEPLANGWAAATFLWRAASTIDRGWLFEREGLDPLIASDDYVSVLTQMRQTASRYRAGRRSPDQLWAELRTGDLNAILGFPGSSADDDTALNVTDPPLELSTRRVLLDPFTPVAMISANCRQSAAAQTFLQWLAGGPGSDSVRRQFYGMTLTRAVMGTGIAETGAPTAYDRWLQSYLASAVTRPTLQLIQFGDYYAALDEQVGRCLDGDATPEAALKQVDERWRELTAAVGAERQQRAWLRAQGMTG